MLQTLLRINFHHLLTSVMAGETNNNAQTTLEFPSLSISKHKCAIKLFHLHHFYTCMHFWHHACTCSFQLTSSCCIHGTIATVNCSKMLQAVVIMNFHLLLACIVAGITNNHKQTRNNPSVYKLDHINVCFHLSMFVNFIRCSNMLPNDCHNPCEYS